MSGDAFPLSDHDRLVRLQAKHEALEAEFRRVSNGVGWPRCERREERLEELGDDIRKIEERLNKGTWHFFVTIAGIVSAVVIAKLIKLL
jgi:hypothetical protein